MHDDVYQMYLEEIAELPACTPEEEAELLARLRQGDESARARLLEGELSYITELARGYSDQGLPMSDLVQEANLALMMAVAQAAGNPALMMNLADQADLEEAELSSLRLLIRSKVDEMLTAAIAEQSESRQVGEELLARVNVLKRVSEEMSEELGREASVEELAQKMKMTVDEIKGIMKLTLDAMSVSPDAEE